MELGNAEVCAFMDYVEHRVPIEVYNVDDDVLAETHVFGFKTDAKANQRGSHSLA